MARTLTREQRLHRQRLERDYKAAAKARVVELRKHLKHAKAWRRERLRKVSAICKHGRKLATAHAAEVRARHRAEAMREVEALRAEERARCKARRAAALERAKGAETRAAMKLRDELASQRVQAGWERAPRLSRAAAAKRRVELQAESDDEVRRNLPAELVTVWEHVKARFKGGDHRTRTEAFTEWAAEHPGEVREILDAEIERGIAELIKQEAAQRAAMRTPRAKLRRMTDDELRARMADSGPVPF